MQNLRRLHRKRRPRLPPGAVAASTAVHGLLWLVAALASAAPYRLLPAQTYRVRLVAAADRLAPERLQPRPPEAAEEEHRPPPPELAEAKPPTEKPAAPEKEPASRPTEREPARATEAGEEVMNVDLRGKSCEQILTQQYCDNIARQVLRFWRRPSGGRALRAEISFLILEDGSVTGIEWRRRSGDPVFDLEARGAIEAAGRSRAFGPLPERYPLDRLRVTFFFDPSRL